MSDAAYMLGGFREMAKSDIQGGTITLTLANVSPPEAIVIDANLGVFEIEQTLGPAGFIPKLIGIATVAREDLPEGWQFQSGQSITATPSIGSPRACVLEKFTESGPLIMLSLWDQSQNA